jgi:DNA-directed RNA polymerase specialized sigma subunit
MSILAWDNHIKGWLSMTTHSAINQEARNQLILSCQEIAEQEARAIAERARGLSWEDLASQGLVYLMEQAANLLSCQHPPSLARWLLRRYLAQYAWEYCDVIKIPRARNTNRVQAKRIPLTSLDAPVGEDEGVSLADLLAGEVTQGVRPEYVELHEALAELPEMERRALLLRYARPGKRTKVLGYRTIAKQLGTTEKEAQSLVDAALTCLRYEMGVAL